MEEAAVLWSSRGRGKGRPDGNPLAPRGLKKKVRGMLNVGIMKYWMGDWTNFASVCY